MPKKIRVACLQVNAGSDWRKNVRRIEKQIEAARRSHPHLIALPENCFWRGPREQLAEVASQTEGLIRHFQTWSRKSKIALLIGSVVERAGAKGKYFNTSVLISETGTIARYRKIHLFDVNLKTVKVQESKTVAAGTKVVTAKVCGVTVGLSICYDLRFPELYRALAEKGSRLLFVPANFTHTTGQAHWEILLRARAIENQCFVIAPAQCGTPSNGIRSFGTSLIVDPWGKILAKAGQEKEQTLIAELNLQSQQQLMQSFPVLQHRIKYLK